MSKETPVIYLEDGKYKYMTCSYKTKHFEIPVPVKLGSAFGFSNSSPTSPSQKRIICSLESVFFDHIRFNIYIDDSISRDSYNFTAISQMPEIIDYVADLKNNPVENAFLRVAKTTINQTIKGIARGLNGISPDGVYIDECCDMEDVCECGKEKHGFANHSDWCPLFKEIER